MEKSGGVGVSDRKTRVIRFDKYRVSYSVRDGVEYEGSSVTGVGRSGGKRRGGEPVVEPKVAPRFLRRPLSPFPLHRGKTRRGPTHKRRVKRDEEG